MSARMGAELAATLDRVDDDPNIRVVIITGAGRAFCAGADLSGGERAFVPSLPTIGDAARQANDPPRDWGGQLVLRLFAMNKPLIAAINGPSVGVGATMTL